MIKLLGTAWTSSANKALLLGSGELGKEVVIELQRLGIETIAVDRYDRAPAMHVAHKRYVINMLDYDQVVDVVRREHPDVVIPEVEAINLDALKDLEAEGYRVIPNAEAVGITMNRLRLREFAAEKVGVSTTKYKFAFNEDEAAEACEAVGFPCLIKPEMSSSGHGHALASNKEEAKKAFKEAIAHARGKSEKVIVEEFVEVATELTALTYRHDTGNGIETVPLVPVEHQRPKGIYYYYESWHPATVSEEVISKAQGIAEKVVEALGGLGIFGVEILVTKDGRVLFSEVSPRPHDTGLVTLASMELSEFAIHARAVLGLPVPLPKLLTPAASKVILASEEIEAPCLEGVREALKVRGFHLWWFGKPRSYVERRMGVAIATGSTVEEALRKVREGVSKLKVVRCR
ncbi:phosphoribosylglycinamide formyltransferase [Ignicoccus islandicus DSM 13165]|uniref:Formate-dependent phosphoribosylglycinamide formyltransferase n=1 Tax=Ignicoccus islandicus DSM 13165 TaxID=940295 RepID=A0A0U3F7A3_9CREN|nr:formate-dependent phosphoribosylglycinamide formyltransferase [Ignicoccus islandicus]ALU11513.1 phosphoribosylglycinamide formyltransferase [Ignicoccus islandicus DSM 13165]